MMIGLQLSNSKMPIMACLLLIKQKVFTFKCRPNIGIHLSPSEINMHEFCYSVLQALLTHLYV